ncbi:hypothetical protein HDN1F_23850 [gamma proteobacterium HdN1]|nr:hypothetical protein HDN1F_23850 [gamma proteobacterium HdN1]
MTRLAQWIMASPFNAVLATLLLGFSGIFGWAVAVPATMAGLRHGLRAGVLPLAVALAVAALHWSQGDLTLMGTVVATWCGGWALGASRSWPVTLLITVGTSAIFVVFMQTVGSSQLVKLFEQYQQVIGSLNPDDAVALKGIPQALFLQLMGIWVAMSAVIALFVARSMQARLYNPGGFRQEFHGLRMIPSLSALCVAPLLLIQLWPDAEAAAGLFLIPLLLAGIALVHGIIGRKKLGSAPLVVMYLGLVLIAPVVTPVLLLVALADSFFDFRNRMA